MSNIFYLPNGITGVCDERPGTGKVVMQMFIKSGSVDEKPEEAGLTFLTQFSAFGGTSTRGRDEISETIESKGGDLGGSSGRAETQFTLVTLARHVQESFGVLTDVVRNPVFDVTELEKDRKQILQVLASKGQKPGAKAGAKFIETAFAGQAAANDPMGKMDTVAALTVEQVRQKHKELLNDPGKIVFSFSGDIDMATARQLVEAGFGNLAATSAPVQKTQVSFTPGDYREATNHDQLNLVFGFKAPSMHEENRHAVRMLTELLSGGMSAPLFQEIREKRGLVYRVGASYEPSETNGVFTISASSSKGNAGELMTVTFDLLGDVIKNGFSGEELAKARERILRQMKGNAESTQKTATMNAGQILFHGKLTSMEEFEAKLKKVTSDDIRRAVGNLLRDGNYALSAVGPQDTMPAGDAISAMMRKQVEGVVLPSAAPAMPDIAVAFSKAAQKTEEAAFEQKMTVLPNGLTVVTVERSGNLACGAWVGVGSISESPELAGATHMNEHMMFKGTKSYGPGTIDKIVEGELHGGLNAYTSRDKTAYFFFNLKPEALAKTVDICGEMVFMAKIDHEEFDGKTTVKPDGTKVKGKGERDVVIEELRMYRDQPDDRLFNAMMGAAYPDHPHGLPIVGSEETLRAMTVEMLRAYRDDYYAPNNVVFCAVGPVRHEDFVKEVSDKFGSLQAKDVPVVTAPVYRGGSVALSMEGVTLCDVTLLMPGVPTTDPDIYAYRALSSVLSDGDSSRLTKSIVNDKQLAAGAGTGVQDYRNVGNFVFGANVEAQNIKPLVSEFYSVLRAVVQGMTPGELDKVKASMEMGVLMGMESNGASCNKFACDVQAFGRVITPSEVSENIAKLTVDDVKRVARKLLKSDPTLGLMTPPGTDPQYFPSRAEIIAMRDGTNGAAPVVPAVKPPVL